MNTIFLVGPGGVGKSTTGPLLGTLMSRPFVDLNTQFVNQHGPIREFVARNGYRAYCEAGADLADRIVNESDTGQIIATSSGFLTHEGCDDVIERNSALIRRTGTSVLLMPAADIDEASHVVAFRQVHRWPDRDLVAEYAIAHARLGIYLACADRVVLATGDPESVAQRVALLLAATLTSLVGRIVPHHKTADA